MRKIPELKNEKEIPINIFVGDLLIYEAQNIQDAAIWFKHFTKDTNKRFNVICNGFVDGKPYSYKGADYYFVTHPECVRRFKETKKKNKEIYNNPSN